MVLPSVPCQPPQPRRGAPPARPPNQAPLAPVGARADGAYATEADKVAQAARAYVDFYELSGDELRVCLDSGDEPRPASLRSSQDTNQVSLVLQRESAKQAPQLQR